MIPKKIHYCWFGMGEKPELAKKCIQSWKKYCPDYEIIEWNEDNFDIDQYPYLRWCYDNKKWAFLSDFARLLVVYQNGGIYFDTDVELIKTPDELLGCNAFFGFENDKNIATGLGFRASAPNPNPVLPKGRPCPPLETPGFVGVWPQSAILRPCPHPSKTQRNGADQPTPTG